MSAGMRRFQQPPRAAERMTSMGRILAAHDRCDRHNSAQAVTAVTKNGKELLYCGHCTRKFLDAMVAQGWILATSEDGKDDRK